LKYLISKSANPAHKNKRGDTRLHAAITGKSLECVKIMLDYLPVDCIGTNQDTPLHFASNSGLNDIAAILLERGADPNQTNEDLEASLHFAARKGHLKMAELLFDNGADIDAADKDGETALFFASESGHSDIVKYLLSKSAKLTKNKRGITCLHIASACKEGLECVKLLLEYVPLNCMDIDKDSPLNYAVAEGNKNVVKFLLEKGAEFHGKNNLGRTCLHIATEQGHLEIVKMLVENNADISAENNEGETPLVLAERLGIDDVAEYLSGL